MEFTVSVRPCVLYNERLLQRARQTGSMFNIMVIGCVQTLLAVFRLIPGRIPTDKSVENKKNTISILYNLV